MDLKLKPKVVPKPWGEEVWLVHNDRYALKILRINQGKRFSLQLHEVKTETWYVTKGELEVRLGEETFKALPGDTIHVPPKTIHRLKALTETEFIEVSTPELDDVVRLEDDFGRS
jgi:mannose-6-phosphate isomerase-like protein (cupin superfamily)